MIDALAHAHKAKSCPFERVRLKADALIGNLQVEVALLDREPDGGPAGAAVFGDVVQRFLGDAVQAERRCGRHARRHAGVREIHFDVMLRAHVVADALHGLDQPEHLQPRGVELMRQLVNVARNLRGAA